MDEIDDDFEFDENFGLDVDYDHFLKGLEEYGEYDRHQVWKLEDNAPQMLPQCSPRMKIKGTTIAIPL